MYPDFTVWLKFSQKGFVDVVNVHSLYIYVIFVMPYKNFEFGQVNSLLHMVLPKIFYGYL